MVDGGKDKIAEGGAGRSLTARSIPMPADTITEDYISAGWLLSEMDKAGGKRAYQYIGDRAVTVGIDAMSFRKPVHIGDLVSIYTEIVRLGRSSLVVKVDAVALRNRTNREEKVTEGSFAFVAIDKARRPVTIANRAAEKTAAPQPVNKVFAGPEGFDRILKAEENLRIRQIPLPRDTNYLGDVFGGWILSHMDLAGAKTAERYAACYAVTVGLQSMSFFKPVFVGDEVSFFTSLVRLGNSSVEVKVETWARRRLQREGQEEKVTEGIFTYVSLDRDKRKAPVRRVG